jgi:hypothetical protein
MADKIKRAECGGISDGAPEQWVAASYHGNQVASPTRGGSPPTRGAFLRWNPEACHLPQQRRQIQHAQMMHTHRPHARTHMPCRTQLISGLLACILGGPPSAINTHAHDHCLVVHATHTHTTHGAVMCSHHEPSARCWRGGSTQTPPCRRRLESPTRALPESAKAVAAAAAR